MSSPSKLAVTNAPTPPAAPPGAMPRISARPDPRQGMPSRLGGLNQVQARIQSEWIKPGEYLLKIVKVQEGTTRQPALRPFFVVEAQVLGNEDPDGTKGQNKVGHTVSYMVMLDRDGALRDVRAFFEAAISPAELAALDSGDDAEREAFIAHYTGEGQPLRDQKILMEATNVKTRKGGDFTRVRWFNHSGAESAAE